MINIKYELIHSDAILPYKSNSGDLGYDIYPAFDEDYMVIESGEVKLIPTGIKSAFSEEYGIIFKERSGLGSNGIKVNAGVIDSGYRGEWKVALYNTLNKPILIAKYPEDWSDDEAILLPYNNAIAQAIVLDSYYLKSEIVEDVSKFGSERGQKGFGSSDR